MVSLVGIQNFASHISQPWILMYLFSVTVVWLKLFSCTYLISKIFLNVKSNPTLCGLACWVIIGTCILRKPDSWPPHSRNPLLIKKKKTQAHHIAFWLIIRTLGRKIYYIMWCDPTDTLGCVFRQSYCSRLPRFDSQTQKDHNPLCIFHVTSTLRTGHRTQISGVLVLRRFSPYRCEIGPKKNGPRKTYGKWSQNVDVWFNGLRCIPDESKKLMW